MRIWGSKSFAIKAATAKKVTSDLTLSEVYWARNKKRYTHRACVWFHPTTCVLFSELFYAALSLSLQCQGSGAVHFVVQLYMYTHAICVRRHGWADIIAIAVSWSFWLTLSTALRRINVFVCAGFYLGFNFRGCYPKPGVPSLPLPPPLPTLSLSSLPGPSPPLRSRAP